MSRISSGEAYTLLASLDVLAMLPNIQPDGVVGRLFLLFGGYSDWNIRSMPSMIVSLWPQVTTPSYMLRAIITH